MATFVSRTSGTINSASVWATVVNLTTGRNNGTTLLGTSATASNTPPFVLSTTVDAVGLQVARKFSTASGTMTVELYDMNAASVVGTCTVNVSDIPFGDTFNAGWHVFKFASSVPASGNTYTIRPYCSSSTSMYLWRNSATTNDWSKFVRTTSTPGLNKDNTDQLIIAGEHTGVGAQTTYTVTVDEGLTFELNGGSTGASSETNPSVWINDAGVLTFANAASQTYTMNTAGLGVFAGGRFQIGNATAVIPSNTTATVIINNNGIFAVYGDGTFVAQGSPRTAGKSVVFTKLTANAAVSATALTVADDTGWLSGDTIAVASTTRTYSQYDADRVLSSNATASGLSVTAGMTYAHIGDASNEMQAHVVLLNRNVRILGETVKRAIVRWTDNCTVDCDWVEFKDISTNSANSKGISIYKRTTSDMGPLSINMSYCVVRDGASRALDIIDARTGYSPDITIEHSTFYNFGAGGGVSVTVPGHNVTLNNLVIMAGSAGPALAFPMGSDTGSASTSGTSTKQVTNVTCTSVAGYGFSAIGDYHTICTGTYGNLEAYSCQNNGIFFDTDIINLTVNGLKVWRNNSYGVSFYGKILDSTIKNLLAIGNLNGNIYVDQLAYALSIVFENAKLFGDASFSTAYGVSFSGLSSGSFSFRFEGCDFGGTTNSVRVAHTTNDFVMPASTGYNKYGDIVFDHCLFGAPTPIPALTELMYGPSSLIRFQNYNRVVGDDRVYHGGGSARRQNTTSISGAAIELRPAAHWAYPTGTTGAPFTGIPVSTSMGVRGKGFLVAAQGANTITGNVSVRIDNTYNGTAPRVLALTNYACGVNTTTVLNTHSAAVNTWQSLNFSLTPTANGVLEFVVECAGANTGSVFVDNWQIG